VSVPVRLPDGKVPTCVLIAPTRLVSALNQGWLDAHALTPEEAAAEEAEEAEAGRRVQAKATKGAPPATPLPTIAPAVVAQYEAVLDEVASKQSGTPRKRAGPRPLALPNTLAELFKLGWAISGAPVFIIALDFARDGAASQGNSDDADDDDDDADGPSDRDRLATLLRRMYAAGVEGVYRVTPAADPVFVALHSLRSEKLIFELRRQSSLAQPEGGDPFGFVQQADGLYAELQRGKKSETIWVCGRLNVLGRVRTPTGDGWSVAIDHRDADGRPHRTFLEQARIGQRDWQMPLAAAGLRIDPAHVADLARYFALVEPAQSLYRPEHGGWQDDGKAGVLGYVTPTGETVGVADPSTWLTTPVPGAECRGTADGWREHVGRLIEGNSRLELVVLLALAAPLHRLAGTESIIFNLCGPSSTGKTTALTLGASVSGTIIDKWRLTDNALEAVAERHHDGLLVLDELREIDPEKVGGAAHMLVSGQGKQRMRPDATARPVKRWSVITLSSGEHGLATQLERAGQLLEGGFSVRWIDLAAVANPSRPLAGVAENLHGLPNSAAFIAQLDLALKEQRGTLLADFLGRVAGGSLQLEGWLGWINLRSAEWIAFNVPADAGGQALRVAKIFGFVAAIGEAAVKAGALPWQAGRAFAAVEVCWQTWLAARGGASGSHEATSILATVQDWLAMHGSRIQNVSQSSRAVHPQAGWRVNDTFYLVPRVWRQEIMRGRDATAALRSLAEQGHASDSETRLPRIAREYTEQGTEHATKRGSRVIQINGSILDA